ncbi:MAG: PLP-dependent aminotransferase family protein [Propionibacteriaceae bacterium]
MTYTQPIAQRFSDVASSPIRDILSVVGRADIISFAGGIPDPSLFPVAKIRESIEWVLAHQPSRALQYATTIGEPEIREQAARRLSRHLPTTADQIQITSGSQEGIYLAVQALVDAGDVVLVEEPTYLAAIQAFRMTGAEVISVPSDSDGVLPDALERLIQVHHPKFVYLIPTFQNPSGNCIPLERRHQIAEILVRTGTMLLEDDPYGEIRYDGDPLPPIASMPGMSAQTLLLNSMSKVLAPGLRVAWMRGEGPIMRAIEVAKQAISLQCSVTDQLAVARFLETEDLDAHIREIIEVYRSRRDTLHDSLSKILPDTKIEKPVGGMFYWAKLDDQIDTARLLTLAMEEGMAFVPGWPFYANNPDRSTMRMSFVTNTPNLITEGVTRLSRALARY